VYSNYGVELVDVLLAASTGGKVVIGHYEPLINEFGTELLRFLRATNRDETPERVVFVCAGGKLTRENVKRILEY
jgi:hypothetical protein